MFDMTDCHHLHDPKYTTLGISSSIMPNETVTKQTGSLIEPYDQK